MSMLIFSTGVIRKVKIRNKYFKGTLKVTGLDRKSDSQGWYGHVKKVVFI